MNKDLDDSDSGPDHKRAREASDNDPSIKSRGIPSTNYWADKEKASGSTDLQQHQQQHLNSEDSDPRDGEFDPEESSHNQSDSDEEDDDDYDYDSDYDYDDDYMYDYDNDEMQTYDLDDNQEHQMESSAIKAARPPSTQFDDISRGGYEDGEDDNDDDEVAKANVSLTGELPPRGKGSSFFAKKLPKKNGKATHGLEASSDIADLTRLNKSNSEALLIPLCKVTYNMSILPSGQEVDYTWKKDHVYMPYTLADPAEKRPKIRVKPEQWKSAIVPALTGIISADCYKAIETLMLSYETPYDRDCSLLRVYMRKQEDGSRVVRILKNMAQLALRVPEYCPQPIPLLRRQNADSLALSRNQVACLLCNAFFSTFPDRRSGAVPGKPHLPGINFEDLLGMTSPDRSSLAKLDCLFAYFDKVTTNAPTGYVTFERHVIPDDKEPKWSTSRRKFCRLNVRRDGKLEDEGLGMLQADFANPYVGGGTLGGGAIQEEILFTICPELIISQLFTERLDPNEALLITGCGRYSNYTGYSDSFRFTGDYVDNCSTDKSGRILRQVIAFDAEFFSTRNFFDQFKKENLERELIKAYCAFSSRFKTSIGERSAVATGNWGCGAFGGNKDLKAYLQLLAAAQAQRDVLYITVDDNRLVQDLATVHQYLVSNNFTVGKAYHLLDEYCKVILETKNRSIPILTCLIQILKMPRAPVYRQE